jgi:hypothetical protein
MKVAKRDTYGTQDVYGNEVERFVREGDVIPANLTVPDEDVVDYDDADASVEDVESEEKPVARKPSKKSSDA